MFGGKKKKQQRLADAGVDAAAVLVSVQDTGMTINDNPRVLLTFEVAGPGGSPFQVQTKQTVSRVQIPRPGDQFMVRYDPSDTGNFELLGMVAGGGGAAGATLETASAGQIAAAVQGSGGGAVQTGSAAALLATGQRMNAVLVEFSPSGKTVGDQNPSAPDPMDPVYVMKANLLIEGANPIEAVFMHRVPVAEVPGLRLGRKLDVAVNPANPTREVAIDWAGSAALG